MNKHTVQVYAKGAIGHVVETEAGEWHCPVCAYLDSGELPYARSPAHPYGSQDICPQCKTQYGYDDYPIKGHSLDDMWSRLRIEWLDREGWSESALCQLSDNLGLSRDDLEAERHAYQNDPNWPRAKGIG